MQIVYAFSRKHVKANLWATFLLSAFCIVAFSCSNELHMLLPEGPEGPEGPAGKSAYEVWVDEVNNGTIDWPQDRTDINNFFLYLKGEDGKAGANGKSAYELWVEEVNKGLENPHNPGNNWPKDQTELNDFWYYLAGADGKNGVTPNIGDNGNWWVNGEDTGIPATGKDGQNGKPGESGHTPEITIGSNGNWYIDGVDTGMPSRGEDGEPGEEGGTPDITIGSNGNWFINGVDTGKPSRGENGDDGGMPDITIGTNGNWYIDGVDTGKPSRGEQGEPGEEGGTPDITIGGNGNWFIDGVDTGKPSRGEQGNDGDEGQTGAAGQSAYELWVQEVNKGTVYKDGVLWPKERTTVNDFWEFLRGKDGEDGQDGQDGQDGATLILGSPNVIIQYYGDPDLKEYVDWEDGSVTYKIYDSNGKVAQQGTKVKGIPDSESVYTTNAEGFITVPKDELPTDKAYENIEVEVMIKGETEFKNSANNTIVPAKMQVQLVVNDSKIPTCGAFGEGINLGKPCVNVWFKVQRKKLNTEGKGEWEGILAELGNTQRTVDIYEYASGTTEPTTTSTTNAIELSPGDNNANYNNCKVQIKRKFIYTNLQGLDKTKVEESNDYWGEYATGGFRYASIGIKGCYGEDLMLQAYIKILPAQFAPTIKTLNRTSDIISGTGSSYIVALKGTLDVENINKDIYLAEKYVQSGTEGTLPVYSPQKTDIPSDKGIYQLRISWYTGGTNKTETAYAYHDGNFTTEDTNVTSKFILDGVSTESNFY